MPDPTLNIASASQFLLAQNHAARQPPPVAPVAKSQAGETSIDLSYRGNENSNGAQRPHFDETTLAGPPPTFAASLLEIERDIDVALRRLEARREGNYQIQPDDAAQDTGPNRQQADETPDTPAVVSDGAAQAPKTADVATPKSDTL